MLTTSQSPERGGADEYEQRGQQPVAFISLPQAVPPEVMLAMQFIAHCNETTKARNFVWTTDGMEVFQAEVHQPELHPVQEAAFRQACVRLGRYFDGQGPVGSRKHNRQQDETCQGK